MKALETSPEKKARRIQARLESHLKAPVSLRITDNTTSIVSVRKRHHDYHVRIHHMFLDADELMLTSLSRYISSSSNHTASRLKAFIHENKHKISPPLKPRKTRLRHQGCFFNLKRCFDRLNQTYFEGRLVCLVTWGRRRKHTMKSTIRLGSYSLQNRLIRINPILDRSLVPSYVVDYILYHEMVHHLLTIRNHKRRRPHHDDAFRRMERGFVLEQRAKLWLKEGLSRKSLSYLFNRGTSSCIQALPHPWGTLIDMPHNILYP
jgi:hypothetical protein